MTTEIVTQVPALEAAIEELLASPRYALDIESDGFHSFSGRVCIVTLSNEQRDIVVDTIALGPESARLQRLIQRVDGPCLMHSGSNDVLALKKDYGMRFGAVQDTAVAATLLGYSHTGLAALSDTFLGLKLEKELQRHDWARRPILPEHLAYLVNDTRHLFRLHDLIIQEVARHDLMDEYEIECRVVAESEPRPAPFDPERFRRMRGVAELDDAGRGILRELYQWRNETARVLDRAAFRVAGDGTLIELARTRPRTREGLSTVRGVGEWLLAQAGDALIEAIGRGLHSPAPLRGPQRPNRDNGPRMDPRQRDRLGRLKRWRETEAKRRGVGLQAVLPTSVLHELVLNPPADVDALAAVPRVGTGRARKYGDQILRLVRGR